MKASWFETEHAEVERGFKRMANGLRAGMSGVPILRGVTAGIWLVDGPEARNEWRRWEVEVMRERNWREVTEERVKTIERIGETLLKQGLWHAGLGGGEKPPGVEKTSWYTACRCFMVGAEVLHRAALIRDRLEGAGRHGVPVTGKSLADPTKAVERMRKFKREVLAKEPVVGVKEETATDGVEG